MAEKAVNDFATTLTAGINASTTTIPVASAAPAGLQAGEFRIRIDNELLLVISGQNGNSWTATRGIEGTTAATHAVDAPVRHVVTDASFPLLVQEVIDSSGLATDADLGAHSSTTEGVHGLPNAAPGEAVRRNPGDTGWEAFDPATQAELNTHEADTTAVHGIADTTQLVTNATLNAHLTDTVDAHDASAISIADTGANFTAADVEGALAELAAPSGGVGPEEGTTFGVTTLDSNGDPVITFESVWGIDSAGTAYYDPSGALAGEDALLVVDEDDGSLLLIQPEGTAP